MLLRASMPSVNTRQRGTRPDSTFKECFFNSLQQCLLHLRSVAQYQNRCILCRNAERRSLGCASALCVESVARPWMRRGGSRALIALPWALPQQCFFAIVVLDSRPALAGCRMSFFPWEHGGSCLWKVPQNRGFGW
mmetsp:Transcript_6105/g.17086  ORF Transcript_6105/g.17086 Transcript_6105/m.17086 type:complete len:136 (-) Transcript_6105:19-426(-)